MFSSEFCHRVIDATRKKESPKHILSLHNEHQAQREIAHSVGGYLCALAVELGHIDLVHYLNEERIRDGNKGTGNNDDTYKWKEYLFDEVGTSPLHVACRLGEKKLIHYLLGENPGSSLEEQGYGYVIQETPLTVDRRWNAMNYLLTHDKPELLEAFHEYYKQSEEEYGQSILHLCCESRAFKCAKWCLENKIQDLEARDCHGLTPLLFSTDYGSEYLELFLSYGADVSAKCHEDLSCLHYATQSDSSKFTKDIIKQVKAILQFSTSEQFTKQDYEHALSSCVSYSGNPHYDAQIRENFRLLLKRHGGHDSEIEDPLFDSRVKDLLKNKKHWKCIIGN